MKFQEKKRLKTQLAAMAGSEHQELRKRAEVARNEIIRQKNRAPSLDEMMLLLLDRARVTPEAMAADEEETPTLRTGLVVGLSRARARVQCEDGEELNAPLAAPLAQLQRTAIAVGDMARLGGDPLQVLGVFPRRTRLSRPHPGAAHIERVLAANIDVVGVVTSVHLPPMRPRLLDRALLAIAHGGATPILIATKIDKLSDAERERELARLDPYREQGIPVYPCSSATGEGLPALRAALAERTCVLVGHSGVGKSSLLNALDTELALVTGELRKGDGRGKHTTTASRLYRLEGGIRLIDTPGVRAFGVWKMTPDEVRVYFSEFNALADDCAFANCSHTHEPRCAVKDAVQRGEIAEKRYATYQRLLKDDDDER